MSRGRISLCDRSRGGLRGGRSKVDQSLVVGSRPRARPYVVGVALRFAQSAPRRASPNVNMRWRSIEISPTLMRLSGVARFSSVARRNRGSHRRGPAPQPARYDGLHLDELSRALRRTAARLLGPSGQCGFDGRSRPTEIIRIRISYWAQPSRSLADSTRRVPRSRPASRSTRLLHLPRPRRLDGDERRPDVSGPARAHFRRPAQGRSPRTMTAARRPLIQPRRP